MSDRDKLIEANSKAAAAHDEAMTHGWNNANVDVYSLGQIIDGVTAYLAQPIDAKVVQEAVDLLTEAELSFENAEKPSYHHKNWILNAGLCVEKALAKLKAMQVGKQSAMGDA